MSTHALAHMYAGDDWQINAVLNDETGTPYNLTGSPVVLWTLLDGQGARVIQDSEVNVSITDAVNGKCSIIIHHGITTRLASDIYNDVLRLSLAGITSTLSVGQIVVFADPWKVMSSSLISRPTRFKRIVP